MPIRQVTSDDDMPSRNDRAPNRFGTSLQAALEAEGVSICTCKKTFFLEEKQRTNGFQVCVYI